jgi:hypothetical protein
MFLLMLSSLSFEARGQDSLYNLDDVSNPYVCIQLREVSITADSLEATTSVKAVVDQIKAINSRLGYAQFEKKISTTTLESNGMNTTYMSIRNFTDFKSAEAYAADIAKYLPAGIYGPIKSPFPISNGNYRICLVQKDFVTYYNVYTRSR